MAVLVTTKDLCIEFPTKRVLYNVSLGISSGDRIGIVGRNGDGKSTLLRLICAQLEPQSGQVIKNGTPTMGMLSQADSFDGGMQARDVLVSEAGIPWESERFSREIVEALVGDIDLTKQIGELSGGQRRRLDLARLLIGSWDILLLDEPTNHLDIRAISWLASHLKKRWPKGQGALLVVTHDRWFLDEVCESMWEVHDGNVIPFEGGYSAYVMQRVERERLENLARQKRTNQLRKELAWLSRGAQARRSKPKFHLEQAAALIADEPPIRNSIELKKAAMTRLGKQVLELQNVSVSYPEQLILDNVEWIIGPGDRIGILGENGAGKTTLLKLLAGKIEPSRGTVKVGKTVQLAMLTQGLEELEPVENDVVRVVCSRYKTSYEVDGKLLSPTALLERLGFSRDELNARCKDLSGGQRRRLQFMLTLLEEPNVLILDEPGNDLDTDMMAAMESMLDTWPGTLIVVSHDRYLIERVTDDQFALVDGKIVHVPGGIDAYLSMEAQRHARTKHAVPQTGPSNAKPISAEVPKQALSNAEAHALRKKIASLERKMETQRMRVEEARHALQSCDPYDYEALSKAQAKIEEEQSRLDELEETWLEAELRYNNPA